MIRHTYLAVIATLPLCLATIDASAQPMGNAPMQSAQASTAEPHDGHWWSKKSNVYREGYVSGYHAGLLKAAAGKPTELKGIGSQQLIDGLNTFYADFRNRKIVVEDALGYVVQQIQGEPDDKLAATVLKMRQAAAARGEQ